MAFALTFLTASLPLTKTIEKLADNSYFKTPYPLVANFTSETVPIKDITEFHAALIKRASSAKKPCLLKGILATPLVMESRKGTTNTNDSTGWVCLDIDDAKFSSPEEVMRALGLETQSYVVQYSSSYKLGKNKNLSCHIFFLLSKVVAAPQLKAWLMHLNLTVPSLETNLTLSKSNASLHWPLDISTCQNDKLIYVAHPVFKGMPPPMRDDERIQLVMKKTHIYDVSKMELKPIESLKKTAKDKLNALRTNAGIAPLKIKSKMVGEYEVQTGVGEIAAYEVIDCGEYNRLNLNGGDSQAYWHPKQDATYLHNFKGEASLLLKEVLPNYYADLVRNAKSNDATPSAQGDLLLAFREKVTASYWKGTWNPSTLTLDINTVKSELQLDHFLQGHGRSLGAFIPEWQIIFDPQNPVVVDEGDKIINTFIPTAFMRQGKKNKKGNFPVIQRVLDSAVGTGEIQTHFLNWLAVVWQEKRKPLTAWVLHGTEGTGKGVLFHDVLRPLFGKSHAVQKRATELGSQFNGWLEPALIVFIDEIDADMFVNAKAVEADLRTLITEPTVSIRRMRTDSYEVPNYSAFIFSSNKKRPVAIPAGDRRFNIGVFQQDKLVISQDEINRIGDELEAFAHHLSIIKASFHTAKTVLQTEDRKAVQKMSITSVDQLANSIVAGDLMALWEAMPDEELMEAMGTQDFTATGYAHIVRRCSRESTSKITRDELAVIFKHCVGIETKAIKFAAFLRHHGIDTKKFRIGNKSAYGIDVTWAISKEDKEFLREDLASSQKLKRVK
jgi:hypothetical protein